MGVGVKNRAQTSKTTPYEMAILYEVDIVCVNKDCKCVYTGVLLTLSHSESVFFLANMSA